MVTPDEHDEPQPDGRDVGPTGEPYPPNPHAWIVHPEDGPQPDSDDDPGYEEAEPDEPDESLADPAAEVT